MRKIAQFWSKIDCRHDYLYIQFVTVFPSSQTKDVSEHRGLANVTSRRSEVQTIESIFRTELQTGSDS